MQIPLFIIIHKSFWKSMNESYRLQKRNNFHKESLPVEVNSRKRFAAKRIKKQGKNLKYKTLIKF
jgi:hypothetical protein